MTPPERLAVALADRYRLDRELGAGGMATVYLAHDLRHDREVALKVLKPELAAVLGAERFLHEIKTTANLQHPHILPLHDSGSVDGTVFYVMPFVEGESLRDRLNREKQLPIEAAVRITKEVASALDYAHRRGVIHRDIKPENILLHDGQALVADFGIALAASSAGGSRMTETGMSLGTPTYMSPEQAMGERTVDARTDVYALGCVLFEMLTGEPPFTGPTAQAIVAKVMTAEPVRPTELRKTVPAHVEAATLVALAKLPADRFGSAVEFVAALANPGFALPGGTGLAAVGGAPRGRWNSLSRVTTAIAVVMTVVAAAALRDWLRPEPPKPVERFEVVLGAGRGLHAGVYGTEFALSRDGSRMVYVGQGPSGGTQLWHRAFDDLEPRPISGTEGASYPTLAPDGSAVAFLAGHDIKTVSLAGGAPVTLVRDADDPVWGSDGLVYFTSNQRPGGIGRVSPAGGSPDTVTVTTDQIHWFPDPLPGGLGTLFTVRGGSAEQSRIAVVGPDGGPARDLFEGTMARFAAPGHIVYATATGTLMAVPFDPKRLAVRGSAIPLVEGIQVKPGSASQFALSATGSLLYKTGVGTRSELVWVTRDGKVEPVDSAWRESFQSPALAPEGTRLAIVVRGATTDVWIKQLDRGPSSKLTFEGSPNGSPAWTPDGQLVTFSSNRSRIRDLWTKRADGSAQAVLQLHGDRGLWSPLWSPDGKWLVARTDMSQAGNGDIVAIRPGVDSGSVPVVATGATERSPAFSPDGRWLAYTSSETGQNEIYVVPFPKSGAARWAVSSGGGTEPLWSRRGDELFYRDGAGNLVAVRVSTTPTFKTGQSTVLFSARGFAADWFLRQYDVSADGRFLMIRPVEGADAGTLVLVRNWLVEFEAKVRQ